jgi:hypothetical protein
MRPTPGAVSNSGDGPEDHQLWCTADQKHRWVASTLVLIEPRLRRLKGYRHLPRLRAALQAKIQKVEHVEGSRVA